MIWIGLILIAAALIASWLIDTADGNKRDYVLYRKSIRLMRRLRRGLGSLFWRH